MRSGDGESVQRRGDRRRPCGADGGRTARALYNGQVIGNWDKSEKKKSVDLKYSWFRQVADMDEETLERERQKFTRFLEK